MEDKVDQTKDRIKEAAGVLADDDNLTHEGKQDQAAGKAKEKVVRVKGKLELAVEQMRAARREKRFSRLAK